MLRVKLALAQAEITQLKATLHDIACPQGLYFKEGVQLDGSFLALTHAVSRTQLLARRAMLWPKPARTAGGRQATVPMSDCFVDRALQGGYSVLYDTHGAEPHRFIRELLRRARTQHNYRVVVCGVYAPWSSAQERIEQRFKAEGRSTDEKMAKKTYDTIFPNGGLCYTHFDASCVAYSNHWRTRHRSRADLCHGGQTRTDALLEILGLRGVLCSRPTPRLPPFSML